jgi:hypothetical protein
MKPTAASRPRLILGAPPTGGDDRGEKIEALALIGGSIASHTSEGAIRR